MKVIWLIAGIVLASLILGFWATRKIGVNSRSEGPPLPQQHTVNQPIAPDSAPAPLLTETVLPRPNPRLKRLRPRVTTSDTILTNWEASVGEILSSEEEEELKAKELLGLFPRLPPEGQVEVTQHLGDMLPDDDYPALARYTTNSALAEPVLDALLAELVTRRDQIRLPLLLSIAENEEHPKSEEALDFLEGLLGETYGTNWDQWSASVDQRLYSQPESQTEEMEPSPEE